MWIVETAAAASALLLILHFGMLPPLVRRAWRAPRIRETLTPDALGIPYEPVKIPTVGGKQLHGWWIAAAKGAPAVVMLHGWGGNAQSLLPVAQLFHGSGIACLLLDARNHGRSDDDDFSSMVKFAEDLDYGVEWLRARPEVDPGRIAVLGHSVGAAAALLSASRREDVAGVISIAAFAHPRELMERMISLRGIPYFPFGWWMLRYIERTIGAPYEAIAPINTINRIGVPVLLVHGTDDRRIPVEDAHAIHARRTGESARLLLVSGAGHNAAGALKSHGEALVSFVREVCAPTSKREPPRAPMFA